MFSRSFTSHIRKAGEVVSIFETPFRLYLPHDS